MRTLLTFTALVLSHFLWAQVDLKPKNFPGKKLELAAAIKNFREGEKLLNQAEKGNDSLYILAYQKLLSVHNFNPEHIQSNHQIAKCLVRLGRFTETLPYYKKLEKIDPNFSPNYLPSYAEALWKNAQYLEAQSIYKRYFDINGSDISHWEGMPIDAAKRMDEINTFLIESNNIISREKTVFFKSQLRIPDDAVLAVDPFSEDIYYTVHEENYDRIVRLEKKNNYTTKTAVTNPLRNVSTIKFMSIHSNGKSILMSNGNDLFIISNFSVDTVRYLPAAVNTNNLESSAVFYKNGIVFSSNREGFFRLYFFDLTNGEVSPFYDDKLPAYCNIHISSYDPATDRFVFIRDGKGSIGKTDILFFEDGVEKNAGTKINTFEDEQWVDFTSTGAFFTTHGDSLLRFVKRNDIPFKPVYVSGAHLLSFSDKIFYADFPLGSKLNSEDNIVLIGDIINKPNDLHNYYIRISNPDSTNTPSMVYRDSINGSFRAILPKNANYLVWVHAKGYQPFVKQINGEAVYSGVEHVNINLTPIKNGSGFTLPFISANRELTKEEISNSFELDYLYDWLKENNKIKIQVAVHTDSLNMTPNAIKFGEEKAIGIYNHLRSTDIEKRRLDWIFEGPTSPAYPNNTRQNRTLNRRTEIRISTR